MKKKITVNVIIHMVLIILAVICLFPIFLVLINSFKENAEIVRNPLSLPDIIHLENYIQAWTTGKFAKGFLNSVKLTGCTVIIVLICATLAGYVLAGKRIKGSGAVLMYFYGCNDGSDSVVLISTLLCLRKDEFDWKHSGNKCYFISNIYATGNLSYENILS